MDHRILKAVVRKIAARQDVDAAPPEVVPYVNAVFEHIETVLDGEDGSPIIANEIRSWAMRNLPRNHEFATLEEFVTAISEYNRSLVALGKEERNEYVITLDVLGRLNSMKEFILLDDVRVHEWGTISTAVKLWAKENATRPVLDKVAFQYMLEHPSSLGVGMTSNTFTEVIHLISTNVLRVIASAEPTEQLYAELVLRSSSPLLPSESWDKFVTEAMDKDACSPLRLDSMSGKEVAYWWNASGRPFSIDRLVEIINRWYGFEDEENEWGITTNIAPLEQIQKWIS